MLGQHVSDRFKTHFNGLGLFLYVLVFYVHVILYYITSAKRHVLAWGGGGEEEGVEGTSSYVHT